MKICIVSLKMHGQVVGDIPSQLSSVWSARSGQEHFAQSTVKYMVENDHSKFAQPIVKCMVRSWAIIAPSVVKCIVWS